MSVLSDGSDNLCRVCLATNQNNQNLFGTKRNDQDNTDTFDLLEKFRLCSGVEIMENDGLPTTICMECMIKVNNAHELRKQCQQSDIRLREVYGKLKSMSNTNRLKTTKDQCCQTDYTFTSEFIKMEANIVSVLNRDTSSTVNCDPDSESIEELKTTIEPNSIEQSELNNHLNDTNVKYKQAECEKIVIGKDAYRTRRTTMFKRVTSMENLKNHKERQRQYIKKNANVKRDIVENDYSVNVEDTNSQNSYTCSKCKRYYSSKKSLDKHIATHNEKQFTCEKCDKQFIELDELVKHNKLHKVKEKLKPVLCRICNKNFKKMDTMVRHLNVHKRANPKEVLSILKEIRDRRKLENNGEQKETVTEIGVNSKRKETEEEYINNKYTSKMLKSCERTSSNCCLSNTDVDINEVFDAFDDATSHRCKHCNKCYQTNELLQEHLLIHTEKRFICNVCNMKFFRQDRLESHKTRYGHNKDKASLETQKPSDDKSAIKLINSWIKEELDSDNEEKGFPCKICGKSYDTKRSLLKHELNTHNSQEEGCMNCGDTCNCDVKDKDQQKSNEISKPYRCDECNKSFEKEIKLQRHIRIHERVKEQEDANFKRFLCHICSKTFRQNTGLMFHMRTHTGYKPHVCKYCGRGFTSNSNCINHERTHTGDRPFVCHFCSAAFAKSCTLKAHITTHTGEANYHCKTCGKSFRRLKYLKEHRFTHTGEKPYACKICGTAYSHNGSLFVHEKKCKAQYQTAQNYCQSETSSPSVTPIITILPQTHLNEMIVPLNIQGNKTYVNDIQRISSPSMDSVSPVGTPDLHVHPNSDASDVSLTVKDFAFIGHMFQS
ncbi:zinc finger protein 14-like isoform X1 [Hylaeus volcanicus]|uniref:zinc finger protein 14-like isoform X1 n=1 Tax=Hylaeus volcanicus TaxID=313075 RepID=UPI0023B806F5|nr:zinc finger protein 14-like isoform X1 [Hylaeus volcanicus]